MAVVFDQAEVGDTDALMPEERSHPLLKFVFTSLFSALASVGFLYVTLWWPRQEWRSVRRCDPGIDSTLPTSNGWTVAWRCNSASHLMAKCSTTPGVARQTRNCRFRETLAWDSSDKLLVLELANEIVFAYDVTTQTEIHPSRFDEITVPTITLSDIGFEGRDELELEKKQGVEPVAVP